MATKNKQAKSPVPEGGWSRKKTPPTPRFEASKKRVPEVSWIDADFNDQHLVWRFSEIDIKWEHLSNVLDNRSVVMLIDKLRSFESMRIGELFSPGSDHAKKHEVPSVPDHAQRRLVEISRDDEDELVRLRTTGRGRLYGVMRRHVFHVLWWDPHHRVWPSKKKNT